MMAVRPSLAASSACWTTCFGKQTTIMSLIEAVFKLPAIFGKFKGKVSGHLSGTPVGLKVIYKINGK